MQIVLVVGASGNGKGVLLQSLILDVFTDPSGKSIFQRTYIFSPTINSDHTWEPVKKMLRKTCYLCVLRTRGRTVTSGGIEIRL